MALVRAVVQQRGNQIPPVDGVECLCATFIGFLMHLYFAFHWGLWHFVIAEQATHMRICQYFRGRIGLPVEIDGDLGL